MTHDKRNAAPSFNVRHLHVVAFANAGAHVSGQELLSHFRRLAHEAVRQDDAATVQWSATGRTVAVAGDKPEIWLDLQADTALWLQCQRCLEPVQQAVSVQRAFRFVHDEATAAALDDELEEDVLVYSKDFDLYQLIEDELLMALPVAAYHAQCPQPPKMEARSADFPDLPEPRENPFAALQALKKK